MLVLPEATMPKGIHVSVSVDRSNSVGKEMSRCCRKLWRRANVRCRLKAGYVILVYQPGMKCKPINGAEEILLLNADFFLVDLVRLLLWTW